MPSRQSQPLGPTAATVLLIHNAAGLAEDVLEKRFQFDGGKRS